MLLVDKLLPCEDVDDTWIKFELFTGDIFWFGEYDSIVYFPSFIVETLELSLDKGIE